MARNNEDIWEFTNISTKKQRDGWYVPETVQHPAKMPTYLVDKIIEEYTKPGDVILDPMAGCGTTGVEAVKNGRNCIMVDYERKFCDLMQKNVDLVDSKKQQTITPKGRAVVIHGDARNLSSLLGEVDQIVFSPPYAIDPKNICHTKEGKSLQDYDKKRGYSKTHHGRTGYSDDPSNIGNLKYGSVDSIVMSPPYSEGIGHVAGEKASDEHKKRLEYQRRQAEGWAEGNIAKMKHGDIDAIVTSPPYHDNKSDWDVTSGAAREGEIVTYTDERGKERQNIGNIHYYDRGKPLSHKYAKAPKDAQTYLDAMHQVYAECFKVLKEGGYMVLVVKNFIRNKKIVDLAVDTVKLCESVGFRHVRTHKRKLTNFSFWIINYRKRYPDAPRVDFEHVLVFQKV